MPELMMLMSRCKPRLSLDEALQLPENKRLTPFNEVQPLPRLKRDARRSEQRMTVKTVAAVSSAMADARQPTRNFLPIELSFMTIRILEY